MSNARTARPARRKAAETVAAADGVVARFQRQSHNQVESINRLLKDPDAAAEIERLQARIADLEQVLFEIAGNKDLGVRDDRTALDLRAKAREALNP